MELIQNNTAYNLSNFEPKRNPVSDAPPKPYLVKKPVKTQAQKKAEERIAARKAMRIMVVTSILIIAVGMLIFGRVKLTEMTNQISLVQKEISLSKSEITRLNMEINAKMSLDKVEQYATQILGMVKQDKNQVQYVNVLGGDRVLTSKTLSRKNLP